MSAAPRPSGLRDLTPRGAGMPERDRPRTDAPAKVTGRATYSTDIRRPGMLHAKVLRSPYPHARIVSIDASPARALPGVHAVLTRDEAAGLAPTGTFVKDWPVVAGDRVRYAGDVVAAVAAVDERTALAALDLIDVRYERLPAVTSVEEALAEGAIEVFPEPPPGVVPHYGQGAAGRLRPLPNVSYEFSFTMGDESAWDECDHVFTDEFGFSRMNHMHLEPFVTVAEATDEAIEVWTATQAPFPLRRDLAAVFGLPENRVRVNVPFLGGGFGAKHNPRTESVAVRLSQLTGGRPVRYCMTTEEVFLTNSQHAAVLRYRTGVKADGTFVARSAEVLLDGGAYADLSPLVAEKAGYRAAGAYRWRYLDSVARAVTTNTVPAGAFRGFGGTQATWAAERQLDLIAERLGLSPYELRLKNLKALGELYAPGETPIDSDLAEGLRIVADAIGYADRDRSGHRGMGVAIGIKDGGGVNKPAQARVKITTRGDVLLQCALTEMGQGGHSAMSTLVAEVLGCPRERVRYAPVDTDHSPFDQGTNASSGVAVMGQAVTQAALRARDAVLEFAAERLGCDVGALRLDDWTVVDAAGERHPLVPWIMQTYGGTGFEFTGEGFFKAPNSAAAPLEAPCVFWEVGWAAAEVEVDPDTGKVTVLQLVVSGDAGRVVSALGARGQDEGAAVFGLGQALFEQMRFEDGQLCNGEALLYRVPLAEDVPERFVSITQEQGHAAGPFGAKGLAEGTLLPVAPAIAQAIADAVGVQLTELPMTPARVWAALRRRETEREVRNAAGVPDA